jgi:hypothetical protein
MSAVSAVLSLMLTFVGCSGRESAQKSGPRFVKLQTEFDSAEHEAYAKPGDNGISGQALLTQQGNEIPTCAGSRVLLMPATSYFREMFWHMIVAGSEPEPPEKPDPSLKNMIRRTQCDAQGHFSFSGIPDGTWFILTQVKAKNSALLIAEMTLANGETKEVLLTDKHIVRR